MLCINHYCLTGFHPLYVKPNAVGLIYDSHHESFSLVMQISHVLIQGANIGENNKLGRSNRSKWYILTANNQITARIPMQYLRESLYKHLFFGTSIAILTADICAYKLKRFVLEFYWCNVYFTAII